MCSVSAHQVRRRGVNDVGKPPSPAPAAPSRQFEDLNAARPCPLGEQGALGHHELVAVRLLRHQVQKLLLATAKPSLGVEVQDTSKRRHLGDRARAILNQPRHAIHHRIQQVARRAAEAVWAVCQLTTASWAYQQLAHYGV